MVAHLPKTRLIRSRRGRSSQPPWPHPTPIRTQEALVWRVSPILRLNASLAPQHHLRCHPRPAKTATQTVSRGRDTTKLLSPERGSQERALPTAPFPAVRSERLEIAGRTRSSREGNPSRTDRPIRSRRRSICWLMDHAPPAAGRSEFERCNARSLARLNPRECVVNEPSQ